MLKYMNYPTLINRPSHFSTASRFLDHNGGHSGSSISGWSFSDTCVPIFFSTIAIISLDIQWTKATIILNQQSIISTIVVNIFNHQSIIIAITEINIFDHQSTNSAIAINFWITSSALIPLLTDMASHTGCGNWMHSWRFGIVVHVCQFIRSRADANVQYFRSPSKGSYGLLQPHFTMGTLVKVQCDKIHHSTANCFNLSTIE